MHVIVPTGRRIRKQVWLVQMLLLLLTLKERADNNRLLARDSSAMPGQIGARLFTRYLTNDNYLGKAERVLERETLD